MQGGAVGPRNNEGRRGGIPGSIAPCFECGANTTGWEGRCVRLSTDEHFAGEFAYDMAIACGREKCIMLFSSEPGHWLKPVRIMGGAVFYGPVFHRIGDDICYLRIKAVSFAYGIG